MTIEDMFNMLWTDYSTLNPIAQKIHALLESKGETVLNDHVAFRTFNHPKVGIDVLARPFLELGYEQKGEYEFKVKKLSARHYEHPTGDAPKVFISELLMEQFSDSLQKKCAEIVESIPLKIVQSDDFIVSGRLWDISFKDYEKLSDESEYAGWLSAFGFRPNHFTVNVNALKNFDEISEINDFLKENKFSLNSSGGEVKGNPGEYLEQSSTLANQIEIKFTDGSFKIPACYYEFAKRYPMENGKLYQGFVAASADKIFESTDRTR